MTFNSRPVIYLKKGTYGNREFLFLLENICYLFYKNVKNSFQIKKRSSFV